MNIRLLLRTSRRDLIKTKYILGGKINGDARRQFQLVTGYWRCGRLVPPTSGPPHEVFDGLSGIYIYLNSGFVGFELRPLLINTAAAASSLYVPSILYRLQ